ncbi:MAG: alpha/beta hydrolase [Mobilicoccus sp.]|nr:alpha/beta hydrolase [Mobilicoccus sp.]
MSPSRQVAMRRGVVVVALIVLVVGAVVAMSRFTGWQRALVYFPDTSTPVSAAQVVPGGRDVTLHTDDGLELGAWLLPPQGADRGEAVLYAPGNGAHRGARTTLHRDLTERGFTVLALDYRGYGGNPGTPSEDGLAADARAALALLRAEGFDAAHTIYLGESLGTGVVTRLATTDPPAAMVLRSPFTSLADVGARHYPFLPVRTLLVHRYETHERIAGVEVPVTVVRGEADSVVPSELSAQVAAAAPHLVEEIVLPGVDHNDPVMFGPLVADAVVDAAEAAREQGSTEG